MCLAKGHASGMARPARRKAERTACSNRIRGMLGEFGVVFAQGATALRQALSGVIEDASNELPGMARLVIQQAQTHWAQLDAHIQWCDERIEAHIKQDAHAKQATQLMGVGPITASAVVATVGDFKQFKHGAQFGAWLGLVPKQNSSGGKNNLGAITKHGDRYLRTLLIQGAKAVHTAQRRRWPTRMGASCGRCLPKAGPLMRTMSV